jgi:hypothetical protein
MEETFCRFLTLSYKKNQKLEQIINFRLLNRSIKKTIDGEFLYYHLDALSKVKNALYYDTKIYDKFYYQKMVLVNLLKKDIPKYLNIKAFTLSGAAKMPGEYYILLNYYIKYPSIKIKLIPIEILIKIIEWYGEFLLEKKTAQELDNILCTIPICYVEHNKKDRNDNNFISVFCYTNTVSKNLLDIFEKKHFCSKDLILLDLSNTKIFFESLINELKEITKNVFEQDSSSSVDYIPDNIATQNKYFGDAFSEFVKKNTVF